MTMRADLDLVAEFKEAAPDSDCKLTRESWGSYPKRKRRLRPSLNQLERRFQPGQNESSSLQHSALRCSALEGRRESMLTLLSP